MALAAADFLDLLRRTTSTAWLDGLLDTPEGTAILNGIFEIGHQAAIATEDGCNTASISLAPGGRPGITTVTLSRAVFATPVTIPTGYPFRAETGAVLRTTAPLTIPGGTQFFVVPLQTLAFSEVVNTFARIAFPMGITGSAASDPSAPIVLDGASNPVLGPPGTVVNTTVIGSSDITQAVSDWLSVNGNERGQQRQASELEEDYRLRVRNIPDAVSPKAISQGANAAGVRVGIAPITLLEPFNDGADVATRAAYSLGWFDTLYSTGTNDVATSPKVDFFDDYYHPVVDRRMAVAYFELDTPPTITMPDSLVFFADTSFFDDDVWGYLDVGDHPDVISSLMAIWEEGYRKRAACVNFDVVLPIPIEVINNGASAAAIETSVIFNSAPLGKSWLFIGLAVGHGSSYPALPPPAIFIPVPEVYSHRVKFIFTDATVFYTPSYFGTDTEYCSPERLDALGFPTGKHIASITGYVTSDGVRLVNLVSDLRVLVFTE